MSEKDDAAVNPYAVTTAELQATPPVFKAFGRAKTQLALGTLLVGGTIANQWALFFWLRGISGWSFSIDLQVSAMFSLAVLPFALLLSAVAAGICGEFQMRYRWEIAATFAAIMGPPVVYLAGTALSGRDTFSLSENLDWITVMSCPVIQTASFYLVTRKGLRRSIWVAAAALMTLTLGAAVGYSQVFVVANAIT